MSRKQVHKRKKIQRHPNSSFLHQHTQCEQNHGECVIKLWSRIQSEYQNLNYVLVHSSMDDIQLLQRNKDIQRELYWTTKARKYARYFPKITKQLKTKLGMLDPKGAKNIDRETKNNVKKRNTPILQPLIFIAIPFNLYDNNFVPNICNFML